MLHNLASLYIDYVLVIYATILKNYTLSVKKLQSRCDFVAQLSNKIIFPLKGYFRNFKKFIYMAGENSNFGGENNNSS